VSSLFVRGPMRRWQKFGVDTTFLQTYYDRAPNDWKLIAPVYVSFPHKADTLTILQKMFGNGQANEAIYIQNCFLDPLYTAPAADCNANHLPAGYSMISSLFPLGVCLTTGFIDRNFASTPAIFRQSLSFPSDDPNG
jgi:hypothetical protein